MFVVVQYQFVILFSKSGFYERAPMYFNYSVFLFRSPPIKKFCSFSSLMTHNVSVLFTFILRPSFLLLFVFDTCYWNTFIVFIYNNYYILQNATVFWCVPLDLLLKFVIIFSNGVMKINKLSRPTPSFVWNFSDFVFPFLVYYL